MLSEINKCLFFPFFLLEVFLFPARKMIKSQAFWVGCISFFVFLLFFFLSFFATRNTGDMRNNSNKHPNSLAKIDVPRV